MPVIDGIEVPGEPLKPDLGPGTHEVSRLFLLCDYLRYRQRLAYADYLDDKAMETQFQNGKRMVPPRMNAPLYNHIRSALYQHLMNPNDKFGNLSALDDFIKPLVVKIYPDEELEPVLKLEQQNRNNLGSQGVFEARANPNQAELQRIYEAFEHDAYAIRYARNSGEERRRNPLLAKGIIKVSPPNGQCYLNFTIAYNARHKFPIGIEGRIYIISNSLVFAGLEQDDLAAFFMVMGHDFKDNKHGGLIVRRHHMSDKKRYFMSKVMIYRRTKNDETVEESGQFAFGDEKLVELNEQDAEKLLNLPQNLKDGRSFIFKESMRPNPDDDDQG